MNDVKLYGNLTSDPDLKYVGGDKRPLIKFSVAVNRTWMANGEQQKKTTFVDCEMWGNRCEYFSKVFSKGDPVLVEGNLEQDSWEDNDGNKRSKLFVKVNDFHRTFGTKNEGPSKPTQAREPVTVPSDGGNDDNEPDYRESGNDIPF